MQFVIWGIAPNSEHETLLVSEHVGIESLEHAKAIMQTLENEHGCSAMRIQKLEPLGDASELAQMFRQSVNI